MARKPEAAGSAPNPPKPDDAHDHGHSHDHGADHVCGSPGPWFSFSLTAGLAAIIGLVGYLIWLIV